jgi:hypothetical protein
LGKALTPALSQRERRLLTLELLILKTAGNMFTLVANPIFGKILAFVGVVLVIIIG